MANNEPAGKEDAGAARKGAEDKVRRLLAEAAAKGLRDSQAVGHVLAGLTPEEAGLVTAPRFKIEFGYFLDEIEMRYGAHPRKAKGE